MTRRARWRAGVSTDKQNILLKNKAWPTRADNTKSCELAKRK
ncbi:hypothetical protein [Escherichia coli]